MNKTDRNDLYLVGRYERLHGLRLLLLPLALLGGRGVVGGEHHQPQHKAEEEQRARHRAHHQAVHQGPLHRPEFISNFALTKNTFRKNIIFTLKYK